MKNTFSKIDKPLFFTMFLLCIFGLVMVFSSSFVSADLRYNFSSTYFFIKQLIFLVVSFIAGFIILKIPTKWYKSVSWIMIISITIVLIIILFKGVLTNHAQSWFYIPKTGFAIQPSEFAKSFLIIFMATFYNYLVKKRKNILILYIIPIGIAIVLGILIAMQPDLGSALILLAIAFSIFISLPFIKKQLPKLMIIFGFGLLLIVIAMLLFGKEILNSEQMSRFNFQNPCQRYKEKTGYQVCNGFIAINNGGLTGVGIGNSTQKYLYLPESHTDFIFAILIEELGLITGIIVLLLYILLLFRILKIASSTYNIRNSILSYGTFWLFTFHIIVNLSGLLALLPLTGVPLPLLSYGGSSTINFVLMIFITERVAIENKETEYQLDLKKLSSN